MAERWCVRCRSARPIEWSVDLSFGPRSESARCPTCGTIWGVRERRPAYFEARQFLHRDGRDAGAGPAVSPTKPPA